MLDYKWMVDYKLPLLSFAILTAAVQATIEPIRHTEFIGNLCRRNTVLTNTALMLEDKGVEGTIMTAAGMSATTPSTRVNLD